MTVNKELVREWVEALRSGKYEQGRKALRSKDNMFCCLGVLCDISKNKLNTSWVLGTNFPDIYSFGEHIGVLSENILDYLGLEHWDYKVEISTTNSKIPPVVTKSFPLSLGSKLYLIDLNDHYKLSFSQIADIIEEEYSNLSLH